MKKPLSKEKIEQIRNLVLTQGNKLTNKEMSKKLRVDIMPFAGVIAGMKANGSLKAGFLRTENEKNKTSQTRKVSKTKSNIVPTRKITSKRSSSIVSQRKVNVLFPKIASITSTSLSRELIQGIELHNESLIKRARFYSTNEFEKSLNKISNSNINHDSQSKLDVLSTVLEGCKCKYVEIV